MAEQLRSDMQCEDLLACFHGLKPLDRECYQAFVAAEEPLTVDDIADAVDRERVDGVPIGTAAATDRVPGERTDQLRRRRLLPCLRPNRS